jgi:hypothetical protein
MRCIGKMKHRSDNSIPAIQLERARQSDTSQHISHTAYWQTFTNKVSLTSIERIAPL